MDKFNNLYNNSLRFLSFRSRSEKEVREHLLKKVDKVGSAEQNAKQNVEEVDQETIEKVIIKLKEQKFINDLEFAKQWIESRMRFRPRSKKLLILELKQKGISKELIEQIFNSQFSIFNETEQIQKLIEKKIDKYRNLSRPELYQKLGGFLARKGFNWDISKEAIDDILKKGV